MIRLAIPALATLVAFVLYLRRPRAYLTFALWCWLVTPLVRRLVDYAIGWQEPNFVLLTPMLVAMVSLLDILRPNKQVPLIYPPVVIFSFASICYGFVVGMLLHPSGEVIYGLANWLAPLALGAHLSLHWREYEDLKLWMERNATWGALLLGGYGIYQYVTAPPWDTFWLERISDGLIDPSFGAPDKFAIRVWSTINSPGPFANGMAAMLLFLFVTSSRWKLPAAVAGYISFLLSFVRTAWLSWGLALVLFLRGVKPKTISRVLLSMMLLMAVVVPLIQTPEIAPVVGDRLKTFTQLGRDESFNERQEMYRIVGNVVLHDPFGHGLRNGEIVNNRVVDSGIFVMLLSLGWLGVALYALGLMTFLFRRGRAKNDDFARTAEAVCLSFLVQLVGGPVFNGVTGAIFWICMGLAIGADRWHAEQESLPGKERVVTLQAGASPMTLVG